MPDCPEFLDAVLAAFSEPDPQRKCQSVAAIAEPLAEQVRFAAPSDRPPGRPLQPELVLPSKVPRRRLGSEAGRAALLHAVAHIEFNAINLALDACWRFEGMPLDYYRDWLRVAKDEARHFGMLSQRLGQMQLAYGALPAHNGLWEAAIQTAHDPLVRMALVPRVLEARGLDVTPGIIERLRAVDDSASVAVLEVILREEVAHVEIGSRWFRFLCAQRELDPDERFPALLQEYGMKLHPPINHEARGRAGFSAVEMEAALAQAAPAK